MQHALRVLLGSPLQSAGLAASGALWWDLAYLVSMHGQQSLFTPRQGVSCATVQLRHGGSTSQPLCTVQMHRNLRQVHSV